MDSSFRFSEREQSTGLVIVFPLGVSGLFNPEIHGLVREVGSRLDGVYVTYALASGSSPTVRDAVSAALFAGCTSAVVVHSEEDDAAWSTDTAASGDRWFTSFSDGEYLDATSIVEAFLTACATVNDDGIAA